MRPRERKVYFLGFFTALIISTISFFSLFRAKPKNVVQIVFEKIAIPFVGAERVYAYRKDRLRKKPSSQVIAELEELGAIFNSTRNLLDFKKMKTGNFFKDRDENRLGSMSPSLDVMAYFLYSNTERRLNTPVLYIKQSKTFSKDLSDYLRSESFLSYLIRSDEQGLRKTFPFVEADQKVIVVGDSVAFGLGVDDRHTVASFMQSKVRDRVQVINAGTNGNSTKENLATVKKFSSVPNAELVYIICTNDVDDFDILSSKQKTSQLSKIMDQVVKYKSSYKRVTIVLHRYINEVIPSYFSPMDTNEAGEDKIEDTLKLKASDSGVKYISWRSLTQSFSAREKNPFSIFSLYIDHCHFSSRGNEMLADSILNELYR